MATVNVRVDDEFTFYVNGVFVFAGTDWTELYTFDLDLAPGDVIAIHAVDTGGPGAAFVDIQLDDGRRFGSSTDWVVSESVPGSEWTSPEFDDSGWVAATSHGTTTTAIWAGTGDAPPAGTSGEWIWSDDIQSDNEVFLRWSVPEAGGEPAPDPDGAPATLNVRVDDAFTFYVNGVVVFSGSDWTQLYSFDLDLAPGDVIAIHAIDTGGPGAAFVDIQFDDGRRFGSSTDWRVSESVSGSDWTSQSFDDSGWASATSHGTTETAIWAGTGDAPPAGTTGEWIWSDDIQADNVVYLRWTVPEVGGNIAPIVSSALADQTVPPDESFSFAVPAGTFFDANGDALTLSATLADGTSLPGWLGFDPGTGTFSGTPTSLETLSVRVTADDGNGGSVYDDFDLTITEAPVAAPATLNVRVDDVFTFYVNGNVVFNGSDWTQLYSFDLDLAPGDVIAIHAIDTGGPGAAFVDIQFDDGRRFGSGTDWRVSENVSGSDWTSQSFDDSGWLPATSHGTTTTAIWAGTGDAPPAGTPGEWIWSDDIRADNVVYLRWTVPEVGENIAPIVSSALADRNVMLSEAFSFSVPAGTFFDANGDALTLSATLADGTSLPGWLGFDPGTGTFSGTPSALETLAVRVTADDGNGGSVYDDFDLTITEEPVAAPATLSVRVDDEFSLYVNGVLVLSGTDWTALYTFDLDLAPGDVIAIHGVDTGGPGAAFVDIQFDDGRRFGSGPDWAVSESVPGSDWTLPSFDDSAWASATSHGTTETEPWAGMGDALPAGTPGGWIWSDDIQADNQVYLRWTVPDDTGDPPDLSFAGEHTAKIVDLEAGFWADAVRILPLGDSITAGYLNPGAYRLPLWQSLVDDHGLWIDYVGQYSNYPTPLLPDLDHQGLDGILAQTVLANIDNIVAANPNDIALILLGTNEVLSTANPIDTVPGRLLDIMRAVDADNPDVKIFLGTLPFINNAANQAEVDAINAQLPSIITTAQSEGIAATLVDFSSISSEDLQPDGVHPNAAGAAEMADAWLQAILAATTESAGTLDGVANAISGVHSVLGSNESDLILGSLEADQISGGAGNDRIEGRAGDDEIDGGPGEDVILGGIGNDVIMGGRDADTFVFDASHTGDNRVVDFFADETVLLTGFSYADVNEAAGHFTQQGADVVFADVGLSVTFENASLGEVTAAIVLGVSTEHDNIV